MKRVYFIKPIGLDGPIKIGCSSVPMSRLRAVEIWSPVELELIGSVPGGHHEETTLHYMFGDVRLHGEWFKATPDLVALIEETLAAGAIPDRVVVPGTPNEWRRAWATAKGRGRKRKLSDEQIAMLEAVEPWKPAEARAA